MSYQSNTAEAGDAFEAMGTIEVRSMFDPIPPTALVTASKHDQTELVRTIGQRLREARELANLSQSEAARRLGYSNPSRLSKLEAASDTNSVPLWLILGAARLYAVSADFLIGLSEDWDESAPRSPMAWLADTWTRARDRDLKAMDALHFEVATVAQTTADLVAAVNGLSHAVSAFQSLNAGWEDMRGGATLVARLGRLEAIARDGDAKLRKLRLSPKEAA